MRVRDGSILIKCSFAISAAGNVAILGVWFQVSGRSRMMIGTVIIASGIMG